MSTPEIDLATVNFKDKRIEKRLIKVVENCRKNAGESLMGSSGGRNSAKAFYRLLGNDKFEFGQLQKSARSATIGRMSGTVLFIQDTSDINLNGHKKTEGLGYCSEHVKGIKLHSCIAVSPEGVPFGLVGQY